MPPTNSSEFLEVESFDREYDLEELLPKEFLETLHKGAGPGVPEKLAVLRPEGSVHYRSGDWTRRSLTFLGEFLAQERPETARRSTPTPEEDILLVPLFHELEPKGYLAADLENTDSDAMVRVAGFVLQQCMSLKHQILLTSGLHGAVVAESYTRLKNKAEQLAVSERKYRELAGGLEVEVQHKTEEIRLAQAHMMHQEKLAAIGQLSAGMAHEINTPLGFVISNLNTLGGYAKDIEALAAHYHTLSSLLTAPGDASNADAVQRQLNTLTAFEKDLDLDFLLSDLQDLVNESITGAERIQKIIIDLKTVARPGIKSEEFVDVNQSIEAVLTIVGNRLGDRIQVSTSLDPVPAVKARPQDLNQVWLSLILNAADAMDSGGCLAIATRADQGLVSIKISDTGSGIPAENLSKIFDPFFTTKDVGKGTGLGLHLVYNLVKSLKGHIQVESRVGRGTSFCVQLPATGI
ncbi:MAG: ATP-binding protein [Desulfosarcinaceae bacterium]